MLFEWVLSSPYPNPLPPQEAWKPPLFSPSRTWVLASSMLCPSRFCDSHCQTGQEGVISAEQLCKPPPLWHVPKDRRSLAMGAAGPWHETGRRGGVGYGRKSRVRSRKPPLEDPPHQLRPSSWPWDPAGCDAGLVGCRMLVSWWGGPHPHLNTSALFLADESCPPSGRCSGA